MGAQSALFQIRQRFGRLLQRLVIVVDDLLKSLRIVGLAGDGRRKFSHRRLLHRLRSGFEQRRVIGAQQLDRVPEADALRSHHPVDHRASRLAGSQAMPQVLLGTDDERRLAILMERAQPQQVRSVLLQLHPVRGGQPVERDLLLQPFDHLVRDARHPGRNLLCFSAKTCQEATAEILLFFK